MSPAHVDGALRLADLFLEGIQDRQRARSFEKVAKVLPYQQKTQWSCSAACLSTVIQHFGGSVTEEEAVDAIGARPGRGAEVTDIVEGAENIGYEAFDFCFESLEQAKVLLDQDIPIICDIQSFNYEGKGHYIVLHKIDEQGCHIMDPNVDGNVRVISHEYLDACWWDHTMAKPHMLKEKWGVVVAPPEDWNG